MTHPRAAIDVSRLPSVVFGSRALTWWGTLGFVVIEGMTLAVCVGSYFYLWRNFVTWPPLGTPNPDLTLPTISVILYVVSIAPMIWLKRAARRMDLRAVQIALLIGCAFILAFCVFRWFEFKALNTRWDSHSYGSVVWTILGFHATLLAVEVAEVIGMTAIMFSDRIEDKHFADAEDISFYWYFLAGVWIPLYLLVFIGPRLI